MALIEFTNRGMYCRVGDFYIDPWLPVNYAVITHAHADHARFGSKHYLAHDHSKALLKLRLGPYISIETMPYVQVLHRNGVKISFHPAGHIIGSAQVRVEYQGEVWVASGDYKTQPDLTCTPFEPIKCHTFITESTFGLPVYRWKPEQELFAELNHWWRSNNVAGKNSIVFAYSLGKAQRVISGLDKSTGPIFVHGAVHNIQQALGLSLFPHAEATEKAGYPYKKGDYRGALIVAPPNAQDSTWLQKFEPYETAIASGWMAVRGMKRRKSVDRGFVISDHADWDGLNQAIRATEAERIYVTHGYTDAFSRFLREQGYDAHAVATRFEGERLDTALTNPDAAENAAAS